MKLNNSVKLITALLVALVLMVTMLPLGVLAADDAAAAETTATAETTAATDETTAPESEDTDDGEEKEEEKKLGVSFWISLGLFGALLIAGAIVAIVKREKLVPWLRSIKSEFKKIVWMPWSEVKKSTLVVIVVVVALALVIGLLDIVFSQGIRSLGNLFNMIAK